MPPGFRWFPLREAPRPAVIREHRLAPWFAVGTVCFGAFMGQLDASIVTLAFPALQRQFGAGLASVQWVSLAYLLTLVALLVPVGRWSDQFGRKLVYLYGFALFAVASAACGLAQSLAMLILLRVVQAAGAAMLQSNSVALVVTSVPIRSRRAALGIQAGAQSIGLAAGPVVGGLIIAAVGWRWIFLVNVPVGLAAITLGWFLLPRTRQAAARVPTDVAGLALLAVAASATMVAASAVSGLGWPAAAIAGALVVAAVSAVALLRWERVATAPLIDLRMLAATRIGPQLVGALCSYLVLFGPLVLLPQTHANAGAGVLRTGLLLSALPAGFGLSAVAAERLLPVVWSNARRCLIGGVLVACSAAALALPTPTGITALVLGMLGIGLGIYIPANNAGIMGAVRAEDSATAGGMVNMTRGLGTAFGVAAVTLGLHIGTSSGHPALGPRLAVAALFVAALAAIWTGRHATASSPEERMTSRAEGAG